MKKIKGDLIKLALEGEFDVIIHGCNSVHRDPWAFVQISMDSNIWSKELALDLNPIRIMN